MAWLGCGKIFIKRYLELTGYYVGSLLGIGFFNTMIQPRDLNQFSLVVLDDFFACVQ